MLRTIGPIALALAAPALAAGCIGEIGGGSSDPPTNTGLQGAQPTTAIPRLSRREVEATIADVFGITGAAERNLAADPKSAVNPATNAEEEVFDTLAATKTPSQVFVDGLESLAFEVARDVSANTAKVDALAGCTPVGALDEACLRSFIANTGLRLWRRPLSNAEIDALAAAVGPLATDPAAGPNGHYVAVRGAISSLLLSPEFVYRTEVGTDVGGGVVQLENHELVARLAYFLWGTAPTPELLGRAGGPELSDGDVAALVDEMLADPRGVRQMRVFHELWLRYTSLLVTDPALASDMSLETSALVDRALAGVTETGDWRQLFTSTETFVSPALATHYGLSAPAEASWVPYTDGRVGLLSHGSFLSLSETKLTETLPSRRGAMIGRRLLCETIMPPPPDVAVDMGVTVPDGSCKSDAYDAHATGTCKGCHQVIDGIGFGFERYDGLGRYREVEEANPACAIEGSGSYGGQTFSGPSDFVAQNLDRISDCAATNLVKFAIRDWAASEDQIERIAFAFEDSHYDFRALMRAVATDASFRHRVEVIEEVSR